MEGSTPTGRRRVVLAFVLALLGSSVSAPADAETAPPLLSRDTRKVDISSRAGSGHFGHWRVDGFGLPAYRYTTDEDRDKRAQQAAINGRTDAWHQVGNDHIVSIAVNHGYHQLWSQDRLYQWVNLYDAGNRHYSGGYGYLNIAGRVISTLYDDRPRGTRTERDFGVGYGRKRLTTDTVDVDQYVYAPFGDDPLLLHDVRITNRRRVPATMSWFEYWDVNPAIQPYAQSRRGLARPAYEAKTKTLSVDQSASDGDPDPLTIFASALRGPVGGFETDVDAFFGDGNRAKPEAVVRGRLGGSIAPPTPTGTSGRTLFAFRAPLKIPAGRSVTLRYAYGAVHREQIANLVGKYRSARDPFGASERKWARWVPQASLPSQVLGRELQWSAYRVRSGASYEETCGYHLISEGGYYMYDNGLQTSFRDPLQHSLAMIHMYPYLTREVIRYSAHEQPRDTGAVPYGLLHLCQRADAFVTNDLDVWLLLTAAEYALATRDFAFFDEKVPYADSGEASLWDHLKLAHFHQEEIVRRGPHGGYLAGAAGDWSDFLNFIEQMTESTLVVAQLAYVYPRLALVAQARGDKAFASELRADGKELRETLRDEWVDKGWYARGYSGARQIGSGVIYLEPQPWAILAGAASMKQQAALVRNIGRFLTGHGAPKGPSKIGSAQSPARNDPDVQERSAIEFGVGRGNAVFVGGVWHALNGHLVWALSHLDPKIPHAREIAWDEFSRNTLAAHATTYPDAWSGVISSDDACSAWYGDVPQECGIGLFSGYNTQNSHQPSWQVFDAVKVAGVEPTLTGYRIDPRVPTRPFWLKMPGVGIASEGQVNRDVLRGYFRPVGGGNLRLEVRMPSGARRVTAWANGKRVSSSYSRGWVRFTLSAIRGRAADWAVTWS